MQGKLPFLLLSPTKKPLLNAQFIRYSFRYIIHKAAEPSHSLKPAFKITNNETKDLTTVKYLLCF